MTFKKDAGGLCMEGGIYTREKCPICGKTLQWIKGKGCICTDHPGQRARTFYVRFPGGIWKNFTNLESAEQELNRLRYEKRERKDQFNPDDYKSSRPNSFASLAPRYLEEKQDLKTFRKIKRTINLAIDSFGDTNVREIRAGEINAFLKSIPDISDKTRSNYQSHLSSFWKWCLEQDDIITLAEMPHFKKIKYRLGWRKITTWEIQTRVIERVKELTYHFNPKIWFGIELLATYAELRPFDLLKIREGDYYRGFVTVFDPTKSENKGSCVILTIKLLPEHAEEWERISEMYPTLNEEMLFFRHPGGRGGTNANTPFGDKYFLKYWNRAKEDLGLEGVGLYGGTRHTTVTETARLLGPKKAKQASGHRTNKAFDRYNQAINEGAFEIISKVKKVKKGEVVPFKKRGSE